jgi:hypothetical protein
MRPWSESTGPGVKLFYDFEIGTKSLTGLFRAGKLVGVLGSWWQLLEEVEGPEKASSSRVVYSSRAFERRRTVA